MCLQALSKQLAPEVLPHLHCFCMHKHALLSIPMFEGSKKRTRVAFSPVIYSAARWFCTHTCEWRNNRTPQGNYSIHKRAVFFKHTHTYLSIPIFEGSKKRTRVEFSPDKYSSARWFCARTCAWSEQSELSKWLPRSTYIMFFASGLSSRGVNNSRSCFSVWLAVICGAWSIVPVLA